VAAWKSKPSWAIISAKDQMLPPAMKESAAKRMGVVTTTLLTCHMAILQEPVKFAAVIDEAASNALANKKAASAI
jgi:pimeloyl-ACP methyl ester carboxylesterase